MSIDILQHAWIDPQGKEHSGEALAYVDNFTVIDCCQCSYKHVTPLPTPDELEHVYSHEYYSQEKPLYIERYLEDKEWWDGVYAERYAVFEKHLGPSRRRLLDVGSGPGLFLALGRKRGWSVKGIEPSSQAAQYSRESLQLDVEEMFLTPESATQLGAFDAINMGEVLEHLPEPAAMLETVHELLAVGGLVCLIVPNDFNPFQNILWNSLSFKPWWVAPPHHLNYFCADSLRGLVESKGFEVVSMETTFPLDMFLLMGLNYIGDDSVGRRIHGYRMHLEKNLWAGGGGELKSKLYTALADLGLGREIVLFARKKV